MDMNFRKGVFALLFILVVVAVFPPVLYGQERVHTVQRGDTFFSIARTFGIRAEDLMRHNGVTDPTRLMVGQRLRIPTAPAASRTTTEFTNYRVVRGDTLFGIARRFSITVGAIQEANNLSQNHVIREGDTLRIPTVAMTPTGAGSPAVAGAPAENRPPAATTPSPPPVVVAVPPRATGPTGTITPDSSVRWPINAREISSMTGKLQGVVITGTRSEPVLSLTRGTVLSAGPYRGFGRVVIVQTDGGYLYVYGGNETLSVREGDRVSPGTELGRLGIDAVSNQPQLFFMIYRNNIPIDPVTAPRA